MAYVTYNPFWLNKSAYSSRRIKDLLANKWMRKHQNFTSTYTPPNTRLWSIMLLIENDSEGWRNLGLSDKVGSHKTAIHLRVLSTSEARYWCDLYLEENAFYEDQFFSLEHWKFCLSHTTSSKCLTITVTIAGSFWPHPEQSLNITLYGEWRKWKSCNHVKPGRAWGKLDDKLKFVTNFGLFGICQQKFMNWGTRMNHHIFLMKGIIPASCSSRKNKGISGSFLLLRCLI